MFKKDDWIWYVDEGGIDDFPTVIWGTISDVLQGGKYLIATHYSVPPFVIESDKVFDDTDKATPKLREIMERKIAVLEGLLSQFREFLRIQDGSMDT